VLDELRALKGLTIGGEAPYSEVVRGIILRGCWFGRDLLLDFFELLGLE
jgi:hypothetical protein